MAEPWIGLCGSFFFTWATGYQMTTTFCGFIAFGLVPFVVLLWLYNVTDIMFQPYRKTILTIAAIWNFIYTGIFITSLLIIPSLIGYLGSLVTPLVFSFAPLLLSYLIPIHVVVLITGINFGLKTRKDKDKNPDFEWRGNFLILAYNLFATGALIDSFYLIHPAIIVLKRTILICSSLMFYFGFFLPKFISRRITEKP